MGYDAPRCSPLLLQVSGFVAWSSARRRELLFVERFVTGPSVLKEDLARVAASWLCNRKVLCGASTLQFPVLGVRLTGG